MADDKKKDAKKSWFDIDSFVAGYGLRWVKSMLNSKLSEWKMMAVTQAKADKIDEYGSFYFQLAELFHTGETADREFFEAAARVGVEFIDGLIDQLPFVPKKLKDLGDDLGGDAITEIRDHFANTDVVIPENLPKIKGEKMAKEAGERLKNFLKEVFTSAFDWLKRIVEHLPKINAGFTLHPKINDFLRAMFAMEDQVVTLNFFAFFDRALMKKETSEDSVTTRVPDHDAIDDFVDMAENWDTLPECIAFFSKPVDDQVEMFSKARMLKHHTGFPRLHRDTMRIVREADQAVAGAVETVIPKVLRGLDWAHEELVKRQQARLAARRKQRITTAAVIVIGAYLWAVTSVVQHLFAGHMVAQGTIIAFAIMAPVMIFAWAQRRNPDHG